MVYIIFTGKCKVTTETHAKLLLMARKQTLSTTKLHHNRCSCGCSWDSDVMRNANSDEIKYCGFGLCPNRYAFITRPEVLENISSRDVVCFMSNQMGKLKHFQWFFYEEKIGSISDKEFQRRMALNHN